MPQVETSPRVYWIDPLSGGRVDVMRDEWGALETSVAHANQILNIASFRYVLGDQSNYYDHVRGGLELHSPVDGSRAIPISLLMGRTANRDDYLKDIYGELWRGVAEENWDDFSLAFLECQLVLGIHPNFRESIPGIFAAQHRRPLVRLAYSRFIEMADAISERRAVMTPPQFDMAGIETAELFIPVLWQEMWRLSKQGAKVRNGLPAPNQFYGL